MIVLYDGDCGLCDRAVRFLAARDRRRRLRFAPLQGEAAAPWRAHARTAPSVAGAPYEWLVAVEGAAVHVRSDAVLRALLACGPGWRAAARLAGVIPRRWRDAAYLAIARRRHRLAAASCPLPPPGDPRFLR